jgi:hypothetical protein
MYVSFISSSPRRPPISNPIIPIKKSYDVVYDAVAVLCFALPAHMIIRFGPTIRAKQQVFNF